MPDYRSNPRQNKMMFCFYEIERQQQLEPGNKNKEVMLDLKTESKIKFQPILSKREISLHKLLESLFEGYQDLDEIIKMLKYKRVNPRIATQLIDRDDLQYYIPQLISYMVIEQNLSHQQFNDLIIEACLTDFFFAHYVYFYMQSLSTGPEGEAIMRVRNFIESEFLPRMEIYSDSRLSGHQLTRSALGFSPHIGDYLEHNTSEDKQMDPLILNYGKLNYPNPPPDYPPTVDRVKIKVYNEEGKGFMETPHFWMDLVSIGEKISQQIPSQRNKLLRQLIKQTVNVHLPAAVYIPFFLDCIQYYTILNVEQGRIFSTKERAPFSVWIELYREEEEQKHNVLEQIKLQTQKEQTPKQLFLQRLYNRLSAPLSIIDGENTLKIKNYVITKKKKITNAIKRNVRFKSFYEKDIESNEKFTSMSVAYEVMSDEYSRKSSDVEDMINHKDMEVKEQVGDNHLDSYFPPCSDDVIQEYRKKSIYRDLRSWRMIHLMVKVGDDLRQEQFAMQLINRFQYIFEKENVPCLLKSYEVLALGPDFGLIEMINDVITFDALFKKLSFNRLTLREFFDQHFQGKKAEAKHNFMRSLAGYSLVTYFLQVKDRHNGNILLHRNGSLIHIDFGFFLSNLPGKGVELEKKVPFKLLTPYVQVLGSLHSELFFEFRQLFYKGFQAILKNRNLIISLVKMMYKSHQGMMNCFIKGDLALQELKQRLNPPGDLQNFCYDLINNSLDNWRARWYDKIQYFFQKIYY